MATTWTPALDGANTQNEGFGISASLVYASGGDFSFVDLSILDPCADKLAVAEVLLGYMDPMTSMRFQKVRLTVSENTDVAAYPVDPGVQNGALVLHFQYKTEADVTANEPGYRKRKVRLPAAIVTSRTAVQTLGDQIATAIEADANIDTCRFTGASGSFTNKAPI